MGRRKLPNIIITGTPGVGKTTTSEQLISRASDENHAFKHLSVNDVVKTRGCHEGFDDERQTYIVDEEKLMDEVERLMFPAIATEERKTRVDGDGDGGEEIEDEEEEEDGGWIIDWHACDIFPERWIDLVVVLRCASTSVLYDRLAARAYSDAKVQENMDVEIFGTVAEEAREGFTDEGVVVELQSETAEDVESNVERILKWVETWIENQKKD